MALEEVTDTDVIQRCAACEAVNRIELDSITVGLAREEQADERAVPLPPCPTCGATEFLFRSPTTEPEHPSPGSFGHLHRLLVDQVHGELVKRDRVITQLRDEQGKPKKDLARPPATGTLGRWFKGRLKIDILSEARKQERDALDEERER